MRQIVCALLWTVCVLNAQTISSVVNAASFQNKLAPGTLAKVNGSNLGGAASTAVTVGGKAAALVAVSQTQLTIQIPFDAPTGATSIQVGNSPSFPLNLTQYAPALFTENGMGYGNVAAIHADGTLIDDNNPAFPTETITLFATGLGPTVPPLATGAPGPANPPAATAAQPSFGYATESATTVFAVAAPGQVGVYQITVRLTSALVTGTRSAGLSIGGVSSTNDVSIPIAVAWAKPVISKVLSATGIPGSVQDTIQAGSWVAIYGADLTPITTDWTHAIRGDRLPIALAGVRVSIDGKPAAVSFISSGQINVLAPEAATGTVQVVVTNNGTPSEPATAQVRTHAPAFFHWGASKYAVVTRHPDNAYIGGPVLGSGWTGAKPGDVLILWGTGFGPTTPPVPAGVIVSGAASTATLPRVTIGGMDAHVLGAALSPGLAGVYQLAIEIPSGIPPGDALLATTVGGFASPANVYIYVAPN